MLNTRRLREEARQFFLNWGDVDEKMLFDAQLGVFSRSDAS